MKKLLFSLMLMFPCLHVLSQEIVIDPALISTIVTTHSQQQSALNDIKTSESNIMGFQALIQQKMNQIKDLQEKTYNYLSTVQSVVKNAKDIIYASNIAKEVAKYQAEAVKIAVGDPELVTVAYKTEAELISRSVDVMIYINEVALKSGEKNLMDNKQRLELCMHVVNELRAMRALAYSVCRQMKTAKRNGVLQTLMPGEFRYIKNSKKHVEDILSNLKFK